MSQLVSASHGLSWPRPPIAPAGLGLPWLQLAPTSVANASHWLSPKDVPQGFRNSYCLGLTLVYFRRGTWAMEAAPILSRECVVA